MREEKLDLWHFDPKADPKTGRFDDDHVASVMTGNEAAMRRAWMNGEYRLAAVTFIRENESENGAMERLFEATQNIDGPWQDEASANDIGLIDGADQPQRSTSVGDVVYNRTTKAFHACAMFGFTPIKLDNPQPGRPSPRKGLSVNGP